MLNINKAVIAGHVGSVEIRYTGSGKAVLNLSVATNSSSKKDNEKK
jgi:single-stranded DNA-binding protein